MAFEIEGRLIEKGKTVQVSDSFKKREFVVEKRETGGTTEFTDYVKFQLTQDRCDIIEPFNINELLKVSFNIRGNRWEKDGKVSYFTNLTAWKIERASDDQTPSTPQSDYTADDIPDEVEDDLPF